MIIVVLLISFSTDSSSQRILQLALSTLIERGISNEILQNTSLELIRSNVSFLQDTLVVEANIEEIEDSLERGRVIFLRVILKVSFTEVDIRAVVILSE